MHARAIVLAVVLLAATAAQVHAGPCASTTRRVALVIGTNAYPTMPLQNAVRDAKLVASALNQIGFEVVSHEDTSREALLNVLKDFSERLSGLCDTDVALFYYAGMGAEIRRVGYLFTTDMDVKAYYADARTEAEQLSKAVLLSEVLDAFRVHTGPKLIITDTCRVDVHQGRRQGADPARAAEIDVPDNTFLAYATEPLTEAADGPPGGNGPYAKALATQLLEHALPVDVFFRRVRKAVETATAKQPQPQRPFIDSGALYSDVRLGREGAEMTGTATASVCNSARKAAAGKASNKVERRVALVLGVSNYTSQKALPNSLRDADMIANALCQLGFADVVVANDPDQLAFIQAVAQFETLAASADWGLIYYAGHAVEMDGTTYLMPKDAEFERDLDVPDETYPLNRLLNKLNKTTRLRLVIIDACRNDPFVEGEKMRITRFRGALKASLSQPDPGDAVLVAYSTKHGYAAYDGLLKRTNSPFAEALLEEMRTPRLEINMLFRKVRDRVKKATNGEQVPYTYGSLPAREIYLRQR